MTTNFKNINFFDQIANWLIEFYVSVTPIYAILIIWKAVILYRNNNIEHTFNRKWSTIWALGFSMLSISLLFSVIIAAYARFTGQLNALHTYGSTIEFFNVSLDCLKLYFLIISHIVLLIALTTYKNQILDRGYYDASLIPSENNPISDSKETHMQYNKNPDFLFIALIFTLHLILHFLFLTENLLVFFILFESSIIPVFCIIGFFGKRSLKFNAMYYILYFTLVSATPMLLSIIFLYSKVGTFHFPAVQHHIYVYGVIQYDKKVLILLFFGFFIPFAVKLSLFPFHTWLPEAHVESSTEGSIILSGIMLKLGFYGMMKFCIPTFYWILGDVSAVILLFAVLGSITTSFSMYKQLDIKKIIAYSSVVHMNMAVCGFFSFSQTAITGAILFSFAHALSSAGLFCAVGYLYDKLKTRNLLEISGTWEYMPKWSFFFFILILSNAGIPGTINFVAEITLIGGLFENFNTVALFILIALVISSFRNFLLFTQICMGVSSSFLNPYLVYEDTKKKKVLIIKQWDINFSGEGLTLCYITFFSVLTGLNPEFFIDLIQWEAEELTLQSPWMFYLIK